MRNGMLKGIIKDGLCCLCGKNRRCKRWGRGMDISRRCWENVSYEETLWIQADPDIPVAFALLFRCLFCIFNACRKLHPETSFKVTVITHCVFMWLCSADKVCSKSFHFPHFPFFFHGFCFRRTWDIWFHSGAGSSECFLNSAAVVESALLTTSYVRMCKDKFYIALK